MIFWQLFLSFFKIGLTCFGGGYAMLSFIQDEVVVKHPWLNLGEFTDIVAISQMTPGPVGINMATYVGYSATGTVLGSVISTIAVIVPSFIIMLLISGYYLKHKENRVVSFVFKVLRFIVIGLILAAALSLMNKANFVDYYSIIIAVLAFIAGYRFRVHPIILILCGALVGFIFY